MKTKEKVAKNKGKVETRLQKIAEFPPIVKKIIAAIDKEIGRQSAQGEIAAHNVEVLSDARRSVETAAKGDEFRLSEILPIMQELTAHFALLTEELTRGTAGLSNKKDSELPLKSERINLLVVAPAKSQDAANPRKTNIKKQKPKTNRVGLDSGVFKILRTSFCREVLPQNLPAGLETTYGTGWETQRIIRRVSGMGKIEMVTPDFDLYPQNAPSALKSGLKKATETLQTANDKPDAVSPAVVKLLGEIRKFHQLDEVKAAILAWIA